jgi:dihydroorotase
MKPHRFDGPHARCLHLNRRVNERREGTADRGSLSVVRDCAAHTVGVMDNTTPPTTTATANAAAVAFRARVTASAALSWAELLELFLTDRDEPVLADLPRA